MSVCTHTPDNDGRTEISRGEKLLVTRSVFVAILTAVFGGLVLIVPALPAHAAMITVTTVLDAIADDGFCSLREAIAVANTDNDFEFLSPGECPEGSGSDTITIRGKAEIFLAGQLVISSSMEVVGSGVENTVVDGGERDRVFQVSAGQVTIRGLTVQGGRAPEMGSTAESGGGIRVLAGTLEISEAQITGNVSGAAGGGLFVASGARVTVRRTTIDSNRGAAGGGGIANQGALFVHESLIAGNRSNRAGGILNGRDAILNLRNTTVSGNEGTSPAAGTGGLHNSGFAFLNNATIVNNKGRGNNLFGFAGGGLHSSAGATTVVKNSIIANNDGQGGPNDCFGALTSDSRFNLIEDTNRCDLPPRERLPNPDTFKLNQDPMLDPMLAFNHEPGIRSPTRNHLPLLGSPVIDMGAPFPPGGPAADACEPIDQRGVPRLFCDIGAVERFVPVPTELTVTTTADEVDDRPGNGTCATAGNACSLRAAVQEANRLPGRQTISVPAGSYVLSIPPGDEDVIDVFDPAAGADLDLLDDVNLMGVDRATAIVDGNQLSRIFDVAPGVTASIQQMTIRNGTDQGGGGVRVSSASLTLRRVIVEDNESSFGGGGIDVRGLDSVLHIRNSIIRSNRAPFFSGDGGGIAADGQITIEDSRIIDNEASFAGGGLQATGAVSVIRTTIANNRTSGGGGFSNGGGISASGLNLVESTVSGNFAEAQGGGVFASGSIVNSTISRNSSATNGGGVSTSGTLSLLHVTIAFNRADEGGNSLHRFDFGSELSFQNTILASQSSPECAGLSPASRGNNIIDDMSCGPRRTGDRPGIDPRLDEALADNGGPTLTLMLRAGSPAIDAAANVGLLRDQRGVRRPQGARPDIGSVERN